MTQQTAGDQPEESSPRTGPLSRLWTGRPSPTQFSDEARARLQVLHLQYLDDLANGARRIARRNRSDVISASDVEAADRILQNQPRRLLWTVFGTVGGILAGAGSSQFLTVVSQDQITPRPLLWSVGLGLVGFIMVVTSIARQAGRD